MVASTATRIERETADLLHEAGVALDSKNFADGAEWMVDQRADTATTPSGESWPAVLAIEFTARVWPRTFTLNVASVEEHARAVSDAARSDIDRAYDPDSPGTANGAANKLAAPRCQVRLWSADSLLHEFEAQPGSLLLHELPRSGDSTDHGNRGPFRWEFAKFTGDDPARCQRLRIAELSITGELEAKDRYATANPEVRIAQATPEALLDATFPSLEAFCAEQLRGLPRPDQDEGAPSCDYGYSLRPTSGALTPPFRFVHQLSVSWGDVSDRLLLAIETERGIHAKPIVLYSGTYDDRAGSYAAGEVEFLATEGDELWLGVVERSALAGGYAGGPEAPHDVVGQETYNCRLRERLSCVSARTAFGEHSRFDGPLAYQTGGYAGPFVPEVWRWTRTVSVDEQQRFRFGPCLNRDGTAVACEASRYLGRF